MKLGIGCLMLLLLSLVLPLAAQVETRTGPNGSTGQNAPTVLTVTGGTGGGSGGLGFPSGSGGGVRLTSGTGGFPFGSGGGMQFTSGAGAAAAGGCPIPPGPPCSNSAGAGGLVRIMGGTGGAGARSGSAFSSGGSGGSITLQPGAGGTAGLNGRHGASGNVLLAPSFGRVGIGFSSPTVTLDVTPGGGTLADAWNIRSSRRFKTNIQPLEGALQKVERLQGVSYERKTDGKHEIGLVAEDVNRVVPEVVSRDPDTHEVQGMDYSRLAALLIEAVKSQQTELQSQQAEIERLKTQIEQLTSRAAEQ